MAVRLGAEGLAAVFAGACLLACAGSTAEAESPDGLVRRDTVLEHEPCDVDGPSAERLDADGDGRADVIIVRQGDSEVCRAVDLNLDGLMDRYTYFDAQGRMRRQESDYDRDGRTDEIALFRDGVLVEKRSTTTLHGQLDTWHFYENGRLVRTERDSDGDAVVDQWWEYGAAGCPVIHSDLNKDGRPDPGASIDYCKVAGPASQDRAGASP